MGGKGGGESVAIHPKQVTFCVHEWLGTCMNGCAQICERKRTHILQTNKLGGNRSHRETRRKH